MAKIVKLDEVSYEEWVASRPSVIQEMIRKHPPNLLYSMKTTGLRCTIYSYNEDGSVQVNVTGQYNRIMFSRCVFGVDPNDLVECDLPAEGEELGAILTEKDDIDAFLRNVGNPQDAPTIPDTPTE